MNATTTTRRSMRHSALRALGQVRVRVTGHPRPSRFAGRAPFACLELETQPGTSFALECEGTVADTLAALPLGVWTTVQATGRDQLAALVVLDAPQASQAAPCGTTTGDPDAGCLDAAVRLVQAFRARYAREPSPAEAAAVAALWAARAA